ncbi:alpha/beta family hydrolase [Reyranella sp.]|jgi:predicted alpha/beta-hydrolase family hydrolase|uniref:alpha/beta hydrolase family protein n=1 Tax=Reyranella sp. TaxID=1929291 RepID=UPI000BCB98C6|nr:alpha/beta family hydrolase [Reyranella sp.]OYY47090.1 MAG: alpha/beta hydrolase [Rhodospirillales bacterium 35-66-84]OYZ97110.1 MAG: alpha/beta hydrolase [Rhodospirillales bacterium 24-66-33]OZB27563.1 MAG: alpha/beta hydrolase [Rhodospirillales bacterium 39-66-50]HQS14025.1 alpha/beta hydrolase [Reyranella sp.]HQT10510.1 alpha/beta hydrolase [Reyranella sp.]
MEHSVKARKLSLRVDPGTTVSALYRAAPHAVALLVLAHGAGAGMTHPFMAAMAERLAEACVSTFRFQFPYMEVGSKRPDRPAVAHAAIRAAVGKATKLAPALPLFAGGKSFGGRMTSQAQSVEPLPNVRGLVLLGFPLHPPEKPSVERAAHLSDIRIPLLFIQGTRDALAQPALLQEVLKSLGKRATYRPVRDADHSFGVLVRSGRSDQQVFSEVAETAATWIGKRKAVPRSSGSRTPIRPVGNARKDV